LLYSRVTSQIFLQIRKKSTWSPPLTPQLQIFLQCLTEGPLSRRRGRGEGSIYKRQDGLWVGQYELRTRLGKKTKYIYGRTRYEVAAKLAKAIAERDAGVVIDAGSLKARSAGS
jgi:hypothetical protein